MEVVVREWVDELAVTCDVDALSNFFSFSFFAVLLLLIIIITSYVYTKTTMATTTNTINTMLSQQQQQQMTTNIVMPWFGLVWFSEDFWEPQTGSTVQFRLMSEPWTIWETIDTYVGQIGQYR